MKQKGKKKMKKDEKDPKRVHHSAFSLTNSPYVTDRKEEEEKREE